MPASPVSLRRAQGCPRLQHLTLSNNPITTGVNGQRLSDYRKTVIGRLLALMCLDHHPISPKVLESKHSVLKRAAASAVRRWAAVAGDVTE